MRRKSTEMVGTECEICKATGIKLHVHHKDQNAGNDAPENLQTLCVSCHRLMHSPNYTGTPPQRKPCSLCSKPVARKGLCNTHLTRLKRFGSPTAKKLKIGSEWVLSEVGS